MTDRYEESQLWLQEPRLVLTGRDVRISSPHPWQLYHNAAFMFRTLLHCCCSLQDRGHSGILSVSDVGDHWLCPRGLATSDRVSGCRGPGVMYPCPAQPSLASTRHCVAARPGPLTLHPEQTSWVSPVTEDREDTHIRHNHTGQWKRRGIPRRILAYFLHFCILLICQYLLSADKHRSQSTKEVFSERRSYWVLLNKVNISFGHHRSFLGRCKESSERKSEFKWGLQLEKKSSEKISLAL